MTEDEELERLREKKLRQIMKNTLEKETERNNTKSKSLSNKPVEVTDATFSELIQKH